MKSVNIIFSIIIIVLITTILMPTDSNAIPAFARRHKISCSTCHAPIPKLKPYGDEFAGNGFIMKEDEKARDYISAGDDMLWLNKTFPIGVRFDAYAVYDQDKPIEKDLQIPWGLKILSGGTLYKNIGYYFYFYMSERGEVAGIEDAYVHFDNIFGSNLDVMVGQFQTSDPLMKRELRLTFEDYVFYKTKFGTRTNLAYDRGVMLVYGIEKTGTDLIGIFVNGNGKDDAGEDKKFDDDNFKNFGFRVSQGIGEVMSIGGYFYQGKEKELTEEGELGTFENEITYWGPDVNLAVGPIEVTAQYMERKDSNPMYLANGKEYKSTGIIAELIYAPQLDKSRHYFTALYNKIDTDLDEYKYHTATLSSTYLVARNLRMIAEYTRDLENDLNRFTLGMVSGF